MTHSRGWRYWLNVLLFTLGLLAVGCCALLLYLGYRGAMGYIHPPRMQRAAENTPAKFGVDFQPVDLRTEDGLTLKGWYTPPRNGTVILLVHGFGVTRLTDPYAMVVRHGYGALAWDARAQGESEGSFCSMGYYEIQDVKAALNFALNQPGVKHVGALGQSMGAATVIRAAARWKEVEAVVADSSYAGVDEMLNNAVPIPLLRPFVRFVAERETGLSLRDVRPVEDIGRISPRPVLIIQGDRDQLVPPGSAQRLYDAAGEPRDLWIGAGMGHVTMFSKMADEYETRVISFFGQAFSR